MDIFSKPMYLLDLCQDILDIVIRKVKYIRIHQSLKKKWSLYGSICSLSKPCSRCDCDFICYSGGGPGLHFHPGRNLLNISDGYCFTQPSQWNFSSYSMRWQSLRTRKYSYKYYIAGIELLPSISSNEIGNHPSFIVLETLHGLYALCRSNRWDNEPIIKNMTKKQMIKYIMKKEEEEINKFI